MFSRCLIPYLHLACLFIFGTFFSTVHAEESSAFNNKDARVVFIGDSITGHGGGWKNVGYTFPMQEALKAVYPKSKPKLLALGGSGMGVQNWLKIARDPFSKERFLDVKTVGVKATFSEPADIMIIMLGMNDLLAPYVGNRPEELDRWKKNYRELVNLLRKAAKPKVIGLASITMQTEASNSAKNKMLALMNQRVRELAEELDCKYLPVNEAIWEAQNKGRTLSPNFHLSKDMIHPGKIGHFAIAIGMFRGLGEEKAAEYLAKQKLEPQFEKLLTTLPMMSYQVTPQNTRLSDQKMSYRIKYWFHGEDKVLPKVRLSVPEKWEVKPHFIKAREGEFLVTGLPDRLQNLLRLEATVVEKKIQKQISIATPWRVLAGFTQHSWHSVNFNPEKAKNKVDLAIESNANFLSLAETLNPPYTDWQRYTPSVDYLGGNVPGSIDFAAITHARPFEAGYGVQWIQSEKTRPVKLQLSRKGVSSSGVYLTVWLNAKQVYADNVTKKPVAVQVRLNKGRNCLVFKSNHLTWDWHNRIQMTAEQGDSLDELRYSISPPRRRSP